MKMDELIKEYKSLCRTCMNFIDKNVVFMNIFSEEVDTISLVDMIIAVSSLNSLPNDYMPNKICVKCLDSLRLSYTFQKMCKESEMQLRKRLDNFTTTVEVQHPLKNLQETLKLEKVDPVEILIENPIAESDLGEYNTHKEDESDKINIDREVEGTIKYSKGNDGILEVTITTELEGTQEEEIINTSDIASDEFNTDDNEKVFDKKKIAGSCRYCNRKFAYNYNLKRHLKIHTEKKFHCEECTQSFTTNDELINHRKIHNNLTLKDEKKEIESNSDEEEEPYDNLIISSIEKLKSLEIRAKICPFCNKKFIYTYNFNRHLKTHEKKKLHCEVCTESFFTEENLIQHRKIHFNLNKTNTDSELKTDETEAIEYSPIINNVDEDQILLMKRSEKSCPVCNKKFIHNYNFKRHLRMHIRKKLICELCKKCFTTEEELENHKMSHTKIKKSKNPQVEEDLMNTPPKSAPKSCHICGRKLRNSYYLRAHLEMHQKKKFMCEICKKCYKTEKEVELHKSVHNNPQIEEEENMEKGISCKLENNSGENDKSDGENDEMTQQSQNVGRKNTYICGICSETFTRKKHFQKHKTTHKEKTKKEHVCEICNATFSANCKLIVHMNKHKGIRPYVCNICNRGFYQFYRLKEHSIIHSDEAPNLCSICGKLFKARNNLNEHMLRHKGLKTVLCPECPSRFVCRGDLNSHMRTHNKSKCHACTICGSTFAKPCYLERHYRTHNKGQQQSSTFVGKTENPVTIIQQLPVTSESFQVILNENM